MTLKDIAKEAGVSVSTVSRVINNKGPHVARAELQDKIWEIVSRNGYVPNVNAQSLKRDPSSSTPKSNSFSIACLFARTPESINDPFFSRLARSVEEAAFKEGYHVQYSLTEFDFRHPHTIQHMLKQKVRGVVVLGRCDKELLHNLKNNFRYVCYTGLNPPDAKYDQVVCSGIEVMKLAFNYLFRLGHRNIAYIGETKNETRYEGYLQALAEAQIEFRREYVSDVPLSTESGYHGAKELLKRATDVTAIICANDLTAIGAMRAMQEMNVRIPQDMSIIGIDDIDMAQYMSTNLTSVHIPVDDMGHVATKVLLDRIKQGHQVHLRVYLPSYIAERESCAKPPLVPWNLKVRNTATSE